jgi:AAA domain
MTDSTQTNGISAAYNVTRFEPHSNPTIAPSVPANDAPPYKIDAKPYRLIGAQNAPKRAWLYGTFLQRGIISVTVAAGGTGKSMLSIVEAISLAIGRGLLHDWVHQRSKVLVFNLEDGFDELTRRIEAVATYYGLTNSEIGDNLSVISGLDCPFVVASQTKNGTIIAYPVVDALEAEIKARGLDVLIFDPFVKSHHVNENDNGAIDLVATTFAGIANRTGCAIHLVHHSRKTGNKVEGDDSRGASALPNAARAVRSLNPMTQSEAQEAGVEGNHFSYVSIADGKANFAPRSDKAKWVQLVSIDLMNGGEGNLTRGDEIGVPVTWSWPAKQKLSDDDRGLILEALQQSGPWRKDHQAKDWAGYGIIEALGLDRENKSHKARAKDALQELLRAEAVIVVKGQDTKRQTKDFVEVAT